MVRAALTPMSESDRYCIYWLKKYSETYGDAAPNASERALNQGAIQSQYEEHYVKNAMEVLRAQSDSSELGGPVSYERFCELWRVVFPDVVNRPYRSIMGKCKWCGLIDIGRKKCTDEVSLRRCTLFCLLDL